MSALATKGVPRLTVIPPRRTTLAPIEIAVHASMLGGQVAKLLGLFENKTVLPQPSRQEILRALAIPAADAARIVDVSVRDGWFVFGLQDEEPANSLTAAAPQAVSDRR